MSGRICYLKRSDRGGRLASVRLVGDRTDDTWTGRPMETVDAVAAVRAGSAWVTERVRHGGNGSIRFLCVDVDGAVCRWLTAPTSEPAVVAAALAQGGSWQAGDGSAPAARDTGPWAAPLAEEASVQALAALPAPVPTLERIRKARRGAGEETTESGVRLAALAVPDVSVRLFIDALDERGVEVGSVVSLWHAMSAAWDPAGPVASMSGGGVRSDRVVATNAPATAVVLLDPEGRLVWSWSRRGELAAGGSMRLLTEGSETRPEVRVSASEVARLTTDWLSWSAQLGIVPTRIVCIGPEPSESGDGLSAGALGVAIGKAWPGATVDLAVHADPIGATLHRLGGAEGGGGEPDPRTNLIHLTNRVSRSHRSMLIAASLAVFAGAAALTAVAWGAWSAAGETRTRIDESRSRTRQSIVEIVPTAAVSPLPRKDLEAAVNKLKQASEVTTLIDAAKPILAELDTLAFVLSGSEAEVEELLLQPTLVWVTVSVKSTKVAEDLLASIQQIGGSNCVWRGEFSPRAGKLTYILKAAWRSPGGAP